LTLTLLTCGAGALAFRERAVEPPAPADGRAVAAEPAKPVALRTIRVVVLDPQGKAIPDANIKTGIWTDEKNFNRRREYQTDAAGGAQVELPKTFYILRLWASKKPYVTMFANWEKNELANEKNIPAEFTFRLEPSVTAGGRIVDEEGKPVTGA